jgi:hypothetical protein
MLLGSIFEVLKNLAVFLPTIKVLSAAAVEKDKKYP